MKRFLWLIALLGIGGCISIGHADKLPYVVTVTDMGKECIAGTALDCEHHNPCVSKCTELGTGWTRYHLPGFQDCVSSSTAQCDYLYDIASDLNRAHEKGYDFPPSAQAELDRLNKQNKDLQDIVDQFGRGSK